MDARASLLIPGMNRMDRVFTSLRGNARGGEAIVKLSAVAAAMLLQPGCSGRYLDVGAGGSDTALSAGGSAATHDSSNEAGNEPSCAVAQSPSWPSAAECVPAPNSPWVGTWKGHYPVEDYRLQGDAVLTITGLTNDGVPCGTFRVGSGPAIPPATDRAAAYPPAEVEGVGGGPSQFASSLHLYAGHSYPLMDVVNEGSRLAFTVPAKEVYRSWCALQTPPAGAEHSCIVVNGATCIGGSCVDGAGTPISVAQLNLCVAEACYCSGGCCDASTLDGQTRLELHRRSDGTFEGSLNNLSPIYLDPVP